MGGEESALASIEVDLDPGQGEVVICRLRSCSTLSVAMSLGNIPLRAIVDTAAEVTIISDKLLTKLDLKPPKLRDVLLCTAGRDIKGMVVGPVHIIMSR